MSSRALRPCRALLNISRTRPNSSLAPIKAALPSARSDEAVKIKPTRKNRIAAEPELAITSRKLPTSLKKMHSLAALIQHKPLSHAILQMRFSNKRHSSHLEKLLQNARQGAVRKGMDEASLVVDQAWITKGKFVKRVWFKGRGRMAIQRRPRVGIDVRVRDRVTTDRRAEEAKTKTYKKLMKRFDVANRPLYNSQVFTC